MDNLEKAVSKLTEGEDLTVNESKQAFLDWYGGKDPTTTFIAFAIALHTKGETIDEIVGFLEADRQLCRDVEVKMGKSFSGIDVSGTGSGLIKTFNVSTATSFVVSSAGISVPKQSWKSVTSPTGSADVVKELGVDVSKLDDPAKLKNVLDEIGIVLYHRAFLKPYEMRNRPKFWEEVARAKLKFRTIFHIASLVYSLFPIKHRLYGMYTDKYLAKVAKAFGDTGYKRAFVVYGEGGICEVSNFGKTKVAELKNGKVREYILSPSDFGLKKCKVGDIRAVSKKRNIIDFLRVLYGKEKGPKRDLVLANASAALYVLGKVKNFKEGVELADSLIDSRKSSKKLEEFINYSGDVTKLEKWKARAVIH